MQSAKLAALICLLAIAGAHGGDAPVVHGQHDPHRPLVTINLPDELARALGAGPVDFARGRALLRLVRLEEKSGAEGPPIFGVYALEGNELRFVPDFPLSAEGKYRAVVALPDRDPQHADYELHAPPAEPARVEKVYPSADRLPANLLKFYVHFSRPVRQTDAIFDQVHILDEQGKTVYDPWRRFQQWSDDGTRFTLWIHPGRVKKGVNLREEFGPVLKPGHKYTLRIDADVLDLAGRPLVAKFEKTFTAGEEDRQRLSLDAWKVTPPRAGTRDPLLIKFPKPLDRALMQRLITVRDGAGKPVTGNVRVGDDETSWSFTPEAPWSADAYNIHANDLLEDLAGNTAVRVFDADLQTPDARPATTDLRFTPIAAGAAQK